MNQSRPGQTTSGQEDPRGDPEESKDDSECEAILVAGAEPGDEEGTRRPAKDAFGETLEEEELSVEVMGGNLSLGIAVVSTSLVSCIAVVRTKSLPPNTRERSLSSRRG